MKCDELKRHRPDIMVLGEGKALAVMADDPMGVWCHIQDVRDILDEKDKEIAELKKKLMPCLNGDCILTCEVVEKYGKENAELKQKLEDAKATAYAESVDAGMRERRLKRALYKVCDNWAVCEMDYWRKCLEHYEDYFNVRTDEDLTEEKCERMIDNWRKVAHNCRAKAEEYK